MDEETREQYELVVNYDEIRDYLECCFLMADEAEDWEMSKRLARAVVAFCYDETKDPNMTPKKYERMLAPMNKQYIES